MLITTCSHCRARFRVTPQQLNLKQGQVRCGRCQRVFNGFESLERFPDDDTGARLLAAREAAERAAGASCAEGGSRTREHRGASRYRDAPRRFVAGAPAGAGGAARTRALDATSAISVAGSSRPEGNSATHDHAARDSPARAAGARLGLRFRASRRRDRGRARVRVPRTGRATLSGAASLHGVDLRRRGLLGAVVAPGNAAQAGGFGASRGSGQAQRDRVECAHPQPCRGGAGVSPRRAHAHGRERTGRDPARAAADRLSRPAR